MQVTVVPPSPRLAPFVRHFTVVEASEEATRVLLPEPGLLLGLRWAGSATQLSPHGETRMPDAPLTGLLGTARTMRTSAGGGLVVAMFREAGAAHFFDEPLHELFGRTVPLDVLAPRAEVARASSRLQDAQGAEGRARALAELLESRLRPGPPDAVVERALRAIVAARGALRIGELARRLEVRQDPLEKRFRRAVGTSPKHFATLLRVRLAAASAGAGRSLSRVAHEAGYFDQSHFIRDFRAVTGEPPGRFFRAAAYC